MEEMRAASLWLHAGSASAGAFVLGAVQGWKKRQQEQYRQAADAAANIMIDAQKARDDSDATWAEFEAARDEMNNRKREADEIDQPYWAFFLLVVVVGSCATAGYLNDIALAFHLAAVSIAAIIGSLFSKFGGGLLRERRLGMMTVVTILGLTPYWITTLSQGVPQ